MKNTRSVIMAIGLIVLLSGLFICLAWVFPGRMTGGGSVFTSAGVRVTHGFELHCQAEAGPIVGPNNLEVNWEGNRFHLETLTMGVCSDNPLISPNPPNAPFDTYVGTGTGKYNGVSGATIMFTFTDAGEPGTLDTAQYLIKDASGNVVLSVDPTFLTFGNHQAHKK